MEDLHYIEVCYGKDLADLVKARMTRAEAAPQDPPPDPFVELGRIQLERLVSQSSSVVNLGDIRTNS